SRAARCSARPTRTGLLLRALMSSRMPPACDTPSTPTAALFAVSTASLLAASTASRRSRALRLTLIGRGRPPFGGARRAGHRPSRPNVTATQQRQPGGVRHQPGAPGTTGPVDQPCLLRLLPPALDPLRGNDLC